MQADTSRIHRVTLLRHGQSVANHEEILQGQLDSPLSERGQREVQLLAEFWKANGVHFDLIISSPLQRAVQTAQTIASAQAIPMELDPAWMERNFGKAEGLPFAKLGLLRREMPSPSIFDPAFESGESEWDLYQRAGEALRDVICRPQGSYLIVTHGSILNAALYVVLGMPPRSSRENTRFRIENCAYSTLEYDGEHKRWFVYSVNSISHLSSSHQRPASEDRMPIGNGECDR